MSVRIHADPIIGIPGHRFERRWYWQVIAWRGFTYIDRTAGFCYTRLGATIARDRAADRLRRTHGGAQ